MMIFVVLGITIVLCWVLLRPRYDGGGIPYSIAMVRPDFVLYVVLFLVALWGSLWWFGGMPR